MDKHYRFRDSSLTARERATDLISHLTREEKSTLFTSRHEAIPRLGIRGTHFGVEVARGLVQRNNQRESTILPQPWGMAATFDPELMERAGAMVGDEVRISNQMQEAPSSLALFGPTVDMLRDPRWGRNEEAYSEDPCLNAKMTVAYTRGLAGYDAKYLKSAPLLKHFYANNYENERQTTNASITPRLKRDYYLKAFEPAIREGGAVGVMTAYNRINGVEAIGIPEVKHICKDEWGMIISVSDGGDFGQNVSSHRTYRTHVESIADILGKGADLMLDSHEMVDTAVKEALESGLLKESTVDEVLGDVFTLRFMLGEFDPDIDPYAKLDPALLASDAHKKIAVELAEKSMILLENDGLLPFTNDGQNTIAVVGPLANENYTCWYCGYAANQTTVVAGLREYLSCDRVLFDEGFDHIKIKSSASGQYLKILDNGVLSAVASLEDADVFEKCDWDFGSWTLRSLRTGKYVAEGGEASDPISNSNEPTLRSRLDPPMTCLSGEAFGWFVKEWLKVNESKGSIYFKTWQDRTILVNEHLELIAATDPGDRPSHRFEIVTVSKGKDRVTKLAAQADRVLVCAGNHPLINAREEYDRPDIHLPSSQTELLRAAVAGNPNTVLYLITGYPFTINVEKDLVGAVLSSTHLGPSLGHVAARTLFGENNPAGRTPSTWYKFIRDLPALDDYDISKNKVTYLYFDGDPLYPFGYGLSFSKFAYRDFTLNQSTYGLEDTVEAAVTVENTGGFDGDEVVQLYVRPAQSIYKRPLKMLKAFRRIHLKRGETLDLKLNFPISELGFWDTERNDFIVETGEYVIEVGQSSTTILASLSMHVDGVSLRGRNAQKAINAIDVEDHHRVEFLTDRADGLPYLEASDFRSYAVYPGLELGGANALELVFSSPAGQLDLDFIDNQSSETIGHVSAPGTGSLSRFRSIRCPIKAQSGLVDLRIAFSKQTSLKQFRFFIDDESQAK